MNKPEFRVIIAGSRDFNDFRLVIETMDKFLRVKSKTHKIIIVSGTARGADTIGEDYAELRGYEIKRFPAKWTDFTVEPCKIKTNAWGKKYNTLAGHNRNRDMAIYAHASVCYWDGISSGTANMITLSRKHKLPCRVVDYRNDYIHKY